ncbi:hypothetical protein B0H16DRAFT_1732872 [Mycena metata]|uniref:HECT domain-containing protein n=1 Tax=Mycena metata TaxID=1033252 RepID=A0AAD7I0N7_9AGAR|nr:hypothetical protein B0H16DRAFT_1732872 [Mycena metata]
MALAHISFEADSLDCVAFPPALKKSFEQYLAFQQFLADNPHLNNNNGSPASTTAQGAPVATSAPPPALQPPNNHSAPPVLHTYTSSRVPPTPLVAPTSTQQSFLGMSTLAPSASTLNVSHGNQQRRRAPSSSLNTSNSNRTRVRHASDTLPRSGTSTLVVRCARVPAQTPPVLPYRRRPSRGSVEDTLVAGAETPTLNALVLVYPPPEEAGNYRLFQTLHTDFTETLQQDNLVYRYQLPLDSLVNDALRRVVNDMADSPSRYIFPATRRSSAAASALITSVQLLGLVDKGRPSKSLGVHLRIESHTPDMTIATLAFDYNKYGRMSMRDGVFVIRVAVMGRLLSGLRADGCRHTCLGTHISLLFPTDRETMGGDTDGETSGGEDVEDDDEQVVRLLWPAAPVPTSTTFARITSSGTSHTLANGPTPIANGSGSTSSTAASTSTPQPRLALRTISAGPRAPATPPLAPTRPITPATTFALPPTIWDENAGFTPRSNGTYGPDGFTRAIMAAATRGSVTPALRISGTDCDDAANAFGRMIDAAGVVGDYTNILSPDRGAALTQDAAFGPGLEREIVVTLYSRLADSGSFLEPGEGEYLTPRTLFSMDSPIPIPAARLAAFQQLGAVCGLLFVFGHLPPSLSPALFQYIIHEGNFHSLHPSFIGEWYPVKRVLGEQTRMLN